MTSMSLLSNPPWSAYEEFEELDQSTFEAKAAIILHRLGFTQAMMQKPTKDMSGGWRMRVALAGIYG